MWREPLILAVIYFAAVITPAIGDLACQIARFPQSTFDGHMRVILWGRSEGDAMPSVPVEHLIDEDTYDYTR